MKIITFIWNRITAAISTVLLLLLIIALFIGYKVTTKEQSDNVARVDSKQEYLEQLGKHKVSAERAPNIVFILYDDMGYGDIGAGAASSAMIATPNINRLATDGVVLTDFHSPSPVCTPSRAGYLTGRLAPRAGLPNVVFPTDSTKSLIFGALTPGDTNIRLPAEEITLADLLKAAGYATGMVGKWHMGDRAPSLPNDMGFDSYYGALYSNDMEPFALYANREIAVEAPADQRYLTERYTEAATTFIEQHAQEPFFLYFAHKLPSRPAVCARGAQRPVPGGALRRCTGRD